MYAGLLLGYVNVTILYPTILGPEKFGFTRWLLSVSLLFTLVAQLGLPNVVTRFFPYFKDKSKGHSGFLGFVCLLAMGGLFFVGLFLYLGKDWVIFHLTRPEDLNLVTLYYFLLLPAVFFIAYNTILSTYSTTLLKAVVPSFFDQIFSRVFNFVILVAIWLGWIDFFQFMLLFVGGYVVKGIALLGYFRWLGQLFVNFKTSLFRQPIFREMIEYGIFSMFTRGASVAVRNIDIVMVSSILGMAATGVYAVFLYVASIIVMPTSAMITITSPVVATAWKGKNLKLIEQLYKKLSLHSLLVGCLIFIGIWINIDSLISLLGSEFEEGKYVAFFVGLAFLFNIATGNNGVIIIHSPYYRIDLVFSLSLLGLTILTNSLLIPIYGIVGAAMATGLTLFLYNLIKTVYVWNKFKMQPFGVGTFKVLLIGVAVYLINYLLPELENVILNIAFRSLIIGGLYAFIAYSLRISEEVNEEVRKVWKRLLGNV